MTASPAQDVRALLDRLEQAHAAATVPGLVADDVHWERERARDEIARTLPSLVSALRAVADLADEWDADHADWCCTKGCAQPEGRHIEAGALDDFPLGVVPIPPPTVACSGDCTCEVSRYLTGLRSALVAALSPTEVRP